MGGLARRAPSRPARPHLISDPRLPTPCRDLAPPPNGPYASLSASRPATTLPPAKRREQGEGGFRKGGGPPFTLSPPASHPMGDSASGATAGVIPGSRSSAPTASASWGTAR